MFTITPIPALHDNYIWMISHPESGQAIIIDPGESKQVINALSQSQLTLVGILITHHHYDHTHGIANIIKKYPVPVYTPANDGMPFSDHRVQEGDQVTFPDMQLTFDVIDIPGHTNGHIAYVADGMVFCGDTLFTAGCGRVFEGTPKQMLNSLNKLASLPDETNIYCGHEYTAANLNFAATVEPDNLAIQKRIKKTLELRKNNTETVPATLSVEKKTNPFLRCCEPDVIKAAEKRANKKLSGDPVAVFTEIRQWKDHF